MPHAMEQADGNWIRTRRGHVRANDYHRWLKKGRGRQIRRIVKAMLRREEEPPGKFGHHGWES